MYYRPKVFAMAVSSTYISVRSNHQVSAKKVVWSAYSIKSLHTYLANRQNSITALVTKEDDPKITYWHISCRIVAQICFPGVVHVGRRKIISALSSIVHCRLLARSGVVTPQQLWPPEYLLGTHLTQTFPRRHPSKNTTSRSANILMIRSPCHSSVGWVMAFKIRRLAACRAREGFWLIAIASETNSALSTNRVLFLRQCRCVFSSVA